MKVKVVDLGMFVFSGYFLYLYFIFCFVEGQGYSVYSKRIKNAVCVLINGNNLNSIDCLYYTRSTYIAETISFTSNKSEVSSEFKCYIRYQEICRF